MSKHTPLFASSRTAAQLLDMREEEFMQLVDNGHLPAATDIGGGIKRWEVDLLRRIASGAAAYEGSFEW